MDLETDECFAEYPVLLSDGSKLFTISNDEKGPVSYKVKLPEGLTCRHCVMRWHWRVANTWGLCENGTHAVGCGNQETFRSCSDISIVDSLPNGKIFEIPAESPRVAEPIYSDHSQGSKKQLDQVKIPVTTGKPVPTSSRVPSSTASATTAKSNGDDGVDYKDPLWAVKKARSGVTVEFSDPLWALKLQQQQRLNQHRNI